MEKLHLSDVHARWLEDVRKIPCELAAEVGVVSRGPDIAFQYRRNAALSFIKICKEIIEDGGSSKTYWTDPKGAELNFLERGLDAQAATGRVADHHGGRDRRVVVPSLGEGHDVVSVPNGSPFKYSGAGNVVPAKDSAFRYLWDGSALKPGLQRFDKVILATDDDRKGRVLRDELSIRLGPRRCWFITYPARLQGRERGAGSVRPRCAGRCPRRRQANGA